MKHIPALTLLLLFCTGSMAFAEPLSVVFPHRPPFNHIENAQPAGMLYELTARIFADAGIEAAFSEMPPKRILLEMREPESRLCSFGWFKNPEREAFAKFTLPIFQDKPLVALILKKNAARFASKALLKEVVADTSLTLGVVAGWSYGDYVDGLIRQGNPTAATIVNSRELGLMLAGERFSYCLVRPWEVAGIIACSGLQPEEVLTLPFADLSESNKRYILCGRGVPDAVIDRLDASIAACVRLEE